MSSAPRFALALLIALAAVGCRPEYPNCEEDSDCHEGEFCVDGQCQACRTDADCGEGETCNDGRCDPIPGYCGSDADCAEGETCEDNRCVAEAVTELPPPEEPPPAPSCDLQPVYFGFDLHDLSDGARDTLQANADCIRERNIPAVQLTGHTDPRGTEEYNLALGDRRARAVKRYLRSLGVDEGIMNIASMGEEMASGSSEGSWSNDRRVDVLERP